MELKKDILSKLSTKTIYRLLLKNMKYYPSKNRFGIMMAIKEGNSIYIKKKLEFHQSKDITDEKSIKVERKKAWMGLAHVLYYKEKVNEFNNNYSMTDTGFTEPLNPKDKDFIYF